MRPDPTKKGHFFLFQDKIVSTAVILVLKLAHKEYQRINSSFNVIKDEESVFLGQKQRKMEFRRSAHLGVRH